VLQIFTYVYQKIKESFWKPVGTGNTEDKRQVLMQGAYWSSDEKDDTAWGRQFSAEGVSGFGNKEGVARVRCIRKMAK
jgi:hypothetical protein